MTLNTPFVTSRLAISIAGFLLWTCLPACGQEAASTPSGGDGQETSTDDVGTDSLDANSAAEDSAEAIDAASTPYVAKPIDPRFLVKKTLVIAHRGGPKLRPEHTLIAYKNAVKVGTHLLEMDLYRSLDGVLVAMHDFDVNRTTNGTGAIKDKTWAELAKLDAGYRWTRDGGKTFPYRGKGLTIARADETLKAFPNMLFSVELKKFGADMADDVITLFEKHDAIHRTVFVSFSDDTMIALRKRSPSAPTAMALGEMVALKALADADLSTYKAPCLFVQPPFSEVTAAFVAKTNTLGLRLQPFTVNKKLHLQQMIDLGVSGVFTDDPGLLAGMLPK